jgi:hypothetical protein
MAEEGPTYQEVMAAFDGFKRELGEMWPETMRAEMGRHHQERRGDRPPAKIRGAESSHPPSEDAARKGHVIHPFSDKRHYEEPEAHEDMIRRVLEEEGLSDDHDVHVAISHPEIQPMLRQPRGEGLNHLKRIIARRRHPLRGNAHSMINDILGR